MFLELLIAMDTDVAAAAVLVKSGPFRRPSDLIAMLTGEVCCFIVLQERENISELPLAVSTA